MESVAQSVGATSLEGLTTTLDVLVIGAGISGIAAARYLRTHRPQDSFVVVDEKDGHGGTWRTHTYPGVRSDSDFHTFGYSFKPWIGAPLATGDQIMKYLTETIDENALGPYIHYGWRVLSADWQEAASHWRVTLTEKASGKQTTLTARFLWMCQGYYHHDEGYLPDWQGMEDFKGEILHAQTWPAEFDGTDKRVIVIGSGATAATLIPNLSDQVGHITMLQRSPTYFQSMPNEVPLAGKLRAASVPEEEIHATVREELLKQGRDYTRRCAAEPEAVRTELLAQARAFLGDDFDIDTHFSPRYAPWQQRIARIPDGDFYKAIASGKVSVVTDHIDRFVPEGIRVASGEIIEADVVVAATGFRLCAFGDIAFSLDGKPLDFHDTIGYRSMMFTGVPNLVWVMGYFRASWTLRAEMIADFVIRLLDHMDSRGARRATVQLRDPDMPTFNWPEDDFNPGYLLRDQHLMPRRGDDNEWKINQDYWSEREDFAAIDLADRVFVYQ